MPYQIDALFGLTVLVAEDMYYLADAIVAAIESAGGAVQGPFASTKDALEHLGGSGQQPHGAALNIQLEDGDSFPLADELARLGVPFVFASGSTDQIPARFADAPMLPKPYKASQVVEAITALVVRAAG